MLGGKKTDIAVTTERMTHKLRIYSLPDMKPLDNGGIAVYEGEQGEMYRDLPKRVLLKITRASASIKQLTQQVIFSCQIKVQTNLKFTAEKVLKIEMTTNSLPALRYLPIKVTAPTSIQSHLTMILSMGFLSP